MILRYLFVCLLMVFATACAPAATETSGTQSTSGTEASEPAHEAEEDHSDEDADAHGDEDDDHSDEDDDHADDHSGDGERRELGAHEHGAAALMIAWSGIDVAIDLETPSYNVLGFEYAPNSDEEKALLAESVTAFESGSLLQLSPDAGCTVTSVNVQTSFEEKSHDDEAHDEEGHDEDEEDHGEEEGHDEDEEGHDEDAEDHGEEGHDEDEEDHGEEEDHDEDEEGHDEEGHEDDHDDHGEETHSDIDVSYNLECEQPENIASLDASQLFAQFPNFEDIQVQWISDTEQSAADLTLDNPVLELK